MIADFKVTVISHSEPEGVQILMPASNKAQLLQSVMTSIRNGHPICGRVVDTGYVVVFNTDSINSVWIHEEDKNGK